MNVYLGLCALGRGRPVVPGRGRLTPRGWGCPEWPGGPGYP